MLKSSNSATAKFLMFLHNSSGPALRVLEPLFFKLQQHFSNLSSKEFYNIVRDLKRRDIIRTVTKNGSQWAELTKNGELEVLFLKACAQPLKKWDGKWRLVIFDIPEDSREKRNLLRMLLYRNGFQKLQASVFISPQALNREAIVYLQKTGLNKYIRIARVDELDNDKDLRKSFHLA
jgi:CRISPR-associated endonuclease Cas2